VPLVDAAAAAGAHGTEAADAAAGGGGGGGGRGQRQRELLAVGPAAIVVLGQVVGAAGLPYGPHRYAVPDVRVLVNGTDVDGRVDSGPGTQQVMDAPVQRVGQTAAQQVSLEAHKRNGRSVRLFTGVTPSNRYHRRRYES